MYFVTELLFTLLFLVVFIGAFFIFDEAILRGYFATKLRKRFDVESLK